ncbi:MAG: SDR family NAD(P)-dependent oxidoreductase [Lentisphaerales bacterium]|nr:SDR family NAD(P)-dependent oxidoreductase [Lentisphaerales bacterium]
MRVLITGGAKRIGSLLVKEMAAKGHKIAIHYNSSEIEALKLLQEIGGKDAGHTTIQCDLNDISEVSKIFNNLQAWGKPAILINNASTYFRRGFEKFTNEELLMDYTINFFAPLILMREFHNQCGFGNIINFLDKRVDYVEAEAGPYALAKKSLRDATEACAEAWYPKIRVNAISPGPVLLPDELPETGKEQELLAKIVRTVFHFTESDAYGTIRVID